MADVCRRGFGQLCDGREVEAITMTNAGGVSVTVITYGSRLQALLLPDRKGEIADVQLGYPSIDGYLDDGHFMGATIGRVANRIAGGRFALDGREYRVPLNDGPNALHGGPHGFDKALWDVVDIKSGRIASVMMRHVSPDLDQGFPGALEIFACYSLSEQNELTIDYRATTDQTTILNVTNHGYWNLAGEGAPWGAIGHHLTMAANAYTPIDENMVTTGEILGVQDSVFDFRQGRLVNSGLGRTTDRQIAIAHGYDHNFVVIDHDADHPVFVARLQDPVSGRGIELWTNQRGVQLYSGNFLDGKHPGKSGSPYWPGDGIAIEPQAFPDAANKPGFGSIRLAPKTHYHNSIVYRLFAR